MTATIDVTPNPATEHKVALSQEFREMAGEGIAAVRQRDFENGYRLLGEVCDQMRKNGERLPAWIISYYGLTLAMHKARYREAADLCQAAIEAEPMKAEYYANLVEVCVAARQRRKAVSALLRGLAIDAGNTRLLDLQATMGARRAPVISKLDRSHPVNVTLGRIRHVLASPPTQGTRPVGRKKKPD